MKEAGLEGRLLIAMPGIGDPRFHRSVVFICAHSEDGAMGLVVNRRAEGVSFESMLAKLDIAVSPEAPSAPIHFGGPVETSRGFVLHSDDYGADDALEIAGGFRLTGTVDVLREMARGAGPHRRLIALGYAGWGPGQLERELQSNGWLTCEADPDIVFSGDDAAKWAQALAVLGVSPEMLSSGGGTA